MTTAITKESLAARIADLEYGPRSLKEDYTLAAYKMLLATMEAEPDCKERKLFCSTDTARMRKVISASAGTEDAPLYRHAHPAPVVPEEPPEHLLPKGNSRDTTYRRGAIILGWKLCRAAMLNQK